MSPDREGNQEVTGKWEMGSGVGWAKFEKRGGGIDNIEVVFKMGYHLSANFVKRLSLKSFHSPHSLQPFLKNLIPLFEGGGGGGGFELCVEVSLAKWLSVHLQTRWLWV